MGAFADSSDPITQHQNDVAQRLAGDTFFADITIVAEDDGVTEADVDAAKANRKMAARVVTAGKQGAIVIVFMPTLEIQNPDEPGPVVSVIDHIRVLEIPKLNRAAGGTEKRAGKIERNLHRALHLWEIRGICLTSFRSIPYNDGEGTSGRDVFFKTLLPLLPPSRVAIPQISSDVDQLVTLACATNGAHIFYTTDGGFPRSGFGTSTEYDEPFTVALGAMVRAVAYKSGTTASDLAERIIGTAAVSLVDDEGNRFVDDEGNPIVLNG